MVVTHIQTVDVGNGGFGVKIAPKHSKNGGVYGECGANGYPGPRQGDIVINRSLCHGASNARALAATWIHESAHWCVIRAMRAGIQSNPAPGDGSGSYPGNGEGYAAERACFGGVVW